MPAGAELWRLGCVFMHSSGYTEDMGRTRTRALETLLGVLVCACFVLPQLLVSGHLALSEHTVAHHPHGEHEHEAPRFPDSKDDHDPHPVEDHLDPLAEPAVPPTLLHVLVVLAQAGPGLLPFDLPSGERLHSQAHPPRPPPPRTVAHPRAPPIVA